MDRIVITIRPSPSEEGLLRVTRLKKTNNADAS
jgi:hypothetical protein